MSRVVGYDYSVQGAVGVERLKHKQASSFFPLLFYLGELDRKPPGPC